MGHGLSVTDRVGRWFGRAKPRAALAAAMGPLGMLEQLHVGKRTDYGLYLKPSTAGWTPDPNPLAIDIETQLLEAFSPLTMVIDEIGATALPDEAFILLAESARILAIVPTPDEKLIAVLRLIVDRDAIRRCIFVMPAAGTLGAMDWPAIWPQARAAASALGIELGAYTDGGWLFRIGPDRKACTFRPIINPNPEKIARALESICEEM